jgi:hypothetical protein
MTLLPPQSTNHMSPFSPYTGRDFSEGLDSTMGTPPWEKDGSMHFNVTGMTPSFARLQPEVTPPDSNYPPALGPVTEQSRSPGKSDFQRVIFKEELCPSIMKSPAVMSSHGKSTKEVATPFSNCAPSEAGNARTVVTGSGPIRARMKGGIDGGEGKWLRVKVNISLDSGSDHVVSLGKADSLPGETPMSCLRGTNIRNSKADLSLHHIDSITVKFGSPVLP